MARISAIFFRATALAPEFFTLAPPRREPPVLVHGSGAVTRWRYKWRHHWFIQFLKLLKIEHAFGDYNFFSSSIALYGEQSEKVTQLYGAFLFATKIMKINRFYRTFNKPIFLFCF